MEHTDNIGHNSGLDYSAYRDAILSGSQKTTEGMMLTGEALLAAKAAIGHGQWAGFLKNEVSFTQKHATTLMNLFTVYGEIKPDGVIWTKFSWQQLQALMSIKSDETREMFEHALLKQQEVEEDSIKRQTINSTHKILDNLQGVAQDDVFKMLSFVHTNPFKVDRVVALSGSCETLDDLREAIMSRPATTPDLSDVPQELVESYPEAVQAAVNTQRVRDTLQDEANRKHEERVARHDAAAESFSSSMPSQEDYDQEMTDTRKAVAEGAFVSEVDRFYVASVKLLTDKTWKLDVSAAELATSFAADGIDRNKLSHTIDKLTAVLNKL